MFFFSALLKVSSLHFVIVVLFSVTPSNWVVKSMRINDVLKLFISLR